MRVNPEIVKTVTVINRIIRKAGIIFFAFVLLAEKGKSPKVFPLLANE